ncbi:Adenylosuccinate lyase [Handroanthus impetiginosus]|uniref:Adenylosuccinate lyase n=1 Tax=Handroanthus impetiginosus TaxID=429701 RepID=A0A2G9HN15_9LAMI|nr:Adenylosuccinate lyase [Handroanthus impetiginosus]
MDRLEVNITPANADYTLDVRLASLIAFGRLYSRYWDKTKDLTFFMMLEVLRFLGKPEPYLQNLINQFNMDDTLEVKKIGNHDMKTVEYFLKQRCQSHLEISKIRWLLKLSQIPEVPEVLRFSGKAESYIQNLIDQFNMDDALEVKKIEKKKKTKHDTNTIEYFLKQRCQSNPETSKVFFHFAYTTMDIKNMAYALMHSQQREKMASFAARLSVEHKILSQTKILGKFARVEFVTSLGNSFIPCVTRARPHDYIARLFDSITRFNQALVHFDRDIWRYISLGYFKQASEIGSSTMPNKVNPIDFENSKGNCGLATHILSHLSGKLLNSCFRVMRRYGAPEPYKKLKELTRGRAMTRESIRGFIVGLDIPIETKTTTLLNLTPNSYVGEAIELAKNMDTATSSEEGASDL